MAHNYKMKHNIDRLAGFLFLLLFLCNAYNIVNKFNASWAWTFLLVWDICLGIWLITGIRVIPVGWKGQLLFLGGRKQTLFEEEGWRWAPFPFGIKMADCRQQIMALEKLDAITADDVKVQVSGTVVYKIHDLNTYFGVDESGLKRGIDDTRAEVIRTRVRSLPLEKPDNAERGVLDSQSELGTEVSTALAGASVNWGVTILKVIISEIAVDPALSADLELKSKEKLQRAGQEIEVAHFAKMVYLLVNGGTIKDKDGTDIVVPGGRTEEQAVEQIQLALGKATKEIKAFRLDNASAEMLTAIFGKKA